MALNMMRLPARGGGHRGRPPWARQGRRPHPQSWRRSATCTVWHVTR